MPVALLLVALVPAGRQATVAEVAAGGPFGLRFEALAAGIELAYRPDVARFPAVGNTVLIATADGVVLVDGGGAPAVADQILARIRELGSGPLLYLIVTHWHSDHTSGLDRYLAIYPATRIIAHPWTHERMTTALPERLAGGRARLSVLAERARRELETGLDAEHGGPLPAPARKAAEQLLSDLPQVERQYALARTAAPHITTEGGMTLPLAGRRLEIHHLGRSNTPGDLVVHLPAERMLIAGDIVSHPVPFGFPRYPSEVVAVTEALLGFDFGTLVLGHGPPQFDRGHTERVLALQRRAVSEIRRLGAAGLGEGAILQQLDLAPFDEAITRGDERLEHLFDRWYRRPIVGRVLAELAAEGSPVASATELPPVTGDRAAGGRP